MNAGKIVVGQQKMPEVFAPLPAGIWVNPVNTIGLKTA
jgi:hypothetical protein